MRRRRTTRAAAARERVERFPSLPPELLPAVLGPLELRARPAAAVCKAWKAAVAELRDSGGLPPSVTPEMLRPFLELRDP